MPSRPASGKSQLPRLVFARASVARRANYAGELPVNALARLAAAVAAPSGKLKVELHAWPDARGASHLAGRIEGDLVLQCQRCLRDFDFRLDVAVDLRLVECEADEQRLLSECEPYFVADDRLPLHEIVEDEALLAMPLSPRCERDDCTEGPIDQAR